MKYAATLFFLLISYASEAGFTITQNLIEAQKHIGAMRLDKGQALIDVERKANPTNYAADFIENNIDVYRLLISQDEKEYEKLQKRKDIRIDRLKLIDKNSPYLLHTQAEVNLQWAFVNAVFEEYLSVAWEFNTAYDCIQVNSKRFPDFPQNKKEMGLLKAFLGLVPDSYKWILTIAGMEGNFQEGMNEVKKYIDNPEINKSLILERYNAQYVYTLLYLNFVKDKKGAWKYCCQYITDYETNLLSCNIRAYIAMNTDNNDEAIKTLLHRPSSPDYIKFIFMDYLLGIAKLNKLDLDAEIYLKKFAVNTKDKTVLEEVYMRLAWCEWFKSDTANYNIYMRIARKNAMELSKKNTPAASQGDIGRYPETSLLKARLLFDGGYYGEAEEALKKRTLNSFKTPNEKAEYTYRLARIYHESNQLSKAIDFYNQTIKESKDLNTFYAPNSCLQLGYIFVKLNFNQTAKIYFNKVFEYKNYIYKNSIQQKAKAALDKIE